jgi:osmotically-inducible protein OsmY
MRAILILFFLFSLSACGPELMFGGLAGAGTTLAKKKTVGDTVSDVTIWSKINAIFLENNKKIKGIVTDISVEVSEGRVLLTGTTNSAEDRLEILKLVWTVNGVREVLNEVKIADDGKYGFSDFTKDSWITTKVKARFLSNNAIRSLNYNVETIDKVVYILGIAGSADELSTVISEAESVKGITKVINYVRVVTPHEVTEDEVKLDEKKKEKKQTKSLDTSHDSGSSGDKSDFDSEASHEIEIGEDD